ncbi:DotI/IcmL/TraM family protein [Legionella quateirensis]|uniref:Protein IcmL (DotI) n=1 Tax=Legionella quateirensis TaxID=45072 RepID=A0A378L178_9GAMM|nr:DotI/IcmL/TraM family protein [Legionella quateirensis]KTD50904.1 protein IcmL (DotI) [Legionella quateirensis]STY17850.1 protein IcmL (DotI) [Legionella quateirensis]
MKIKSITLGIFCWGLCLATWAVTAQLPASNNSDASMNKSCPCSLQNDDLTKANQSDVAVLVWANEAAVSAFSYNFQNQKTQLQHLSSFFTEQGYSLFLKSLKESGNEKVVQSKKLIVSAVATRAPVILQKGLLDGVYSWRVQIPLLITYQSRSEYVQQNSMVTMLIVRAPSLNLPRGIGVSQFLVEPSK